MRLYGRDKARRSLIDTVAYRAVSQVPTVMVRNMPEADFGVFNLLYAFIPLVSTLASLGLEQTLRRYQPEYLRAGDTVAASWLVRFVASARFGTNVILLGLILLTWNHVAPIFKLAPYRAEFAFFCILVLLHFQASILQVSLASHMLHRYAVGSTAVLSAVKLAGYSIFVWTDSLTLEKALLTDTIAYALAYGLLRIAHLKTSSPAQPRKKFWPDAAQRKRLLRYGLLNNFNDLGTLVMGMDVFFVAAFIDPISVGIYAFYSRLSGMAGNYLPVRLFGNVIQPMFFAMPVSQADQRAPQYFSLLLNMNLLLQWPVLTYAAAYHAELVQVVFAGRFIEYSWLLPMVVFFATLNTISTPVTLMAQYEEKAGIILFSKIFSLYNLFALFVLVPWAGIYGATLASGSAQTFKNLFIWWHVRHRARWLHGTLAFANGLAIWGGALAACYLMKRLQLPPLADLVLGALICSVAALIQFRSHTVSSTDRALLGSILKGKESRILELLGLIKPSSVSRPGASEK
jgi:O-antigen/teichoic acid export membrane protein